MDDQQQLPRSLYATLMPGAPAQLLPQLGLHLKMSRQFQGLSLNHGHDSSDSPAAAKPESKNFSRLKILRGIFRKHRDFLHLLFKTATEKNQRKRSAALVVLLLSLVWLCRAPDWEPLIAFIVALFAYGALDLWQTFHSISTHDANLIREFRKLFPPDSEVVEFLRDHDMAIPYHHRKTEPILRIHDQWKGVDFEFDDKTLEKSKNQFLASVRTYVRLLINETFTHTGNPSMMTMDFSDWDNPPEKIEARDRLNKLGTDLLSQYESFVRVIRRKIKETEQ